MTDFVWIYEMRPHICMKLTTSTVLSHTNELPRNIASMPTKSQKKNELGMPVEAGEASSTGVLELRKRLKGFETEEGRMLGLGFQCVPACPACAAFILLCMT